MLDCFVAFAPRNDEVSRSPDGAKRNPGTLVMLTPDFASLHPGYVVSLERKPS
jgi:hypothetical protein